jgi:Bacterial SH3 domain
MRKQIIILTALAAGVFAGPVWAEGVSEVAIKQNSSHLNIRESGSLKATVLARVAQGAKLKNMGCNGEGEKRWCQVETDAGVKGYAFGKYLQEAAGVAMAPKAPPAFAMGKLKCERNNGSPVAECDYGVIRVGVGKASLQVIWPDGGKRMLGLYGGAAASRDGVVTAKKGADGSYDITLTPKGAPSEHYVVTADVISG